MAGGGRGLRFRHIGQCAREGGLWLLLSLPAAVFGCCCLWLLLYLAAAVFGCCCLCLLLSLAAAVFGCCCLCLLLSLPAAAATGCHQQKQQQQQKQDHNAVQGERDGGQEDKADKSARPWSRGPEALERGQEGRGQWWTPSQHDTLTGTRSAHSMVRIPRLQTSTFSS